MSATMAAPAVSTGRFVWRDVMSTDPQRTKAFYTELFGWTTTANDMGGFIYETIANNGVDFGGMMPLDPAHGIPSNWLSYIHVPDVDAAVATAVELGGSVMTPAMDIPGIGRFAVLQDPQGAHFALLTTTADYAAMNGIDEARSATTPAGGVAWNELSTSDVEGATAFYSAITGWRSESMSMIPGEPPYTVMSQGDRMDAGIMVKPAELPVSLWVIYFQTAQLEESLAEVARLGGQQMGPVMEVPSVGRMAWATDPFGAIFALMEDEK